MFSGVSASTLLAWANDARIWATIIAAIAAVLTGFASYAQIKLQVLVSAQKDALLAEQRRQSDERIAANEAQTAAAHTTLAAEQKLTAQLVKDAEALKSANLKLSLELERERQARSKIEGHVSSRQLSQQQFGALAAILRQRPQMAVDFQVVASDPEAAGFMDQLGRAFEAAGTRPKFSATVLGVQLAGVEVSGPQRAIGLQALRAAGIHSVEGSADCSDAEVCILVGSKPRSM